MDLQPVYLIIEILFVVGGFITGVIILYAKYKTSRSAGDKELAVDAMDNLKITVEAVKTQNALQAGQISQAILERKELNEKIILLTGKVETLSTVPLAKIEQHMADTNRILQAILPLIPSSTVQHTVLETTTTSK